MNPTVATILKALLAIAALFAVPIQTWIEGHAAVGGIVGFLAALLALFLKPPALKGKENDL